MKRVLQTALIVLITAIFLSSCLSLKPFTDEEIDRLTVVESNTTIIT
ncbi:hypothetical protein [Sediminispirochaeta smaragdinae]|jgi:hypothetical protein|uniref:Uncharacterized protein n=1 Tax=Sediminispirochaeta smaragdinae (strain DSM 11293 / JCM 15392 / SEBR 4228) TaxID=573413 RepID=E1R7V6_SEDSS|nr:hypothetical protein [Sediminispirochaeta smaragdinae]ADK82811.1 hypothetical protein Spirs_3725 [Sediminispirochaeta smaragdinae DSM 11293]